MAKQNKTWTYAEFIAAAAKALWTIQQSRKLKSRAQSVLGSLGVNVPDDIPQDTMPEFEFSNVTEPGDTYIGGGMTLADLSEAAKAKRETQRVKSLRQNTFDLMRSLAATDYGYGPGYGECGRRDCPNHPPASDADMSTVTRHFAALDFPLPTQTTVIRAEVRNGDDTEYINTTVPGSLTEDEVRAKLAPHAKHSNAHNITVAAFGEAASDEKLVSGLRVSVRTVWANDPDGK